jgi:hypothetical protein
MASTGSNMYGYTDYNGPICAASSQPRGCCADPEAEGHFAADDNSQSSEEDKHNPLQVGFWMEGDSLAPPCGSSITTIHRLFDFAELSASDVLYDLGCGDARVCLEAYARYQCTTVGVEIEEDLVNRANFLISNLTVNPATHHGTKIPVVLQRDLRDVLGALVRKVQEGLDSQCPTSSVADESSSSVSYDDLPLPTIVVMYLLPDAIDLIQDDLVSLLQALPPNFRVVCNTWGMKKLQKTKAIEIQETSLALTPLMLYTRESIRIE